MNQVGLSLSILSLCGLLSTSGWAGEYSYNNPLCCLSSKSATPPPPPPPCEKITITDSNGQVTIIEKNCPPPPSINR